MASPSVYRRLFQYIFQYKSKLIAVALISLLGVGFEIVKPLPIKIVLDNILSDHPLPAIISKAFANSAVLHDKQQMLVICIALLILITCWKCCNNPYCFQLYCKPIPAFGL